MVRDLLERNLQKGISIEEELDFGQYFQQFVITRVELEIEYIEGYYQLKHSNDKVILISFCN